MSATPLLLDAFLCVVYQCAVGSGCAKAAGVKSRMRVVRFHCFAHENDTLPTWSSLLSAAAEFVAIAGGGGGGDTISLTDAGFRRVSSQCPVEALAEGIATERLVAALRAHDGSLRLQTAAPLTVRLPLSEPPNHRVGEQQQAQPKSGVTVQQQTLLPQPKSVSEQHQQLQPPQPKSAGNRVATGSRNAKAEACDEPHKNVVWPSLDAVPHPFLCRTGAADKNESADDTIERLVRFPGGSSTFEQVPIEHILRTQLKEPLVHCADFFLHDACSRGTSCNDVHVVSTPERRFGVHRQQAQAQPAVAVEETMHEVPSPPVQQAAASLSSTSTLSPTQPSSPAAIGTEATTAVQPAAAAAAEAADQAAEATTSKTTKIFSFRDVFLFRLYRRARVTRNSLFVFPALGVQEGDFAELCKHADKMDVSAPSLLTFDGMIEACRNRVTVVVEPPGSIQLTEYGVSSVEGSLASLSPQHLEDLDRLQETMPQITDYAPDDNAKLALSQIPLTDALICRLLQRGSWECPNEMALSPISAAAVEEDIELLRPYCIRTAGALHMRSLLNLILPIIQWVRLDFATQTLHFQDFRLFVASNQRVTKNLVEYMKFLSHVLPPIAQPTDQPQFDPCVTAARSEVDTLKEEHAAAIQAIRDEVKAQFAEMKREHEQQLSDQQRVLEEQRQQIEHRQQLAEQQHQRVAEQQQQLLSEQQQQLSTQQRVIREQHQRIETLMAQMRHVQSRLDWQQQQQQQQQQYRSTGAVKPKHNDDDDDDWSRM